jgi:hypothetical protein
MPPSERNVASVFVLVPFGARASTALTAPVAGFTRLGKVAAAFGSPGDGPRTLGPWRNCASEYADATVVSSLMRREVTGRPAEPAMVIRRSARPAGVAPPEATR